MAYASKENALVKTVRCGKMAVGYAHIYYTDYDETGRWSLKGNTLTVTVNDKISIPCDYNVTKLTETALEFSLDLGILKARYKFKRVS